MIPHLAKSYLRSNKTQTAVLLLSIIVACGMMFAVWSFSAMYLRTMTPQVRSVSQFFSILISDMTYVIGLHIRSAGLEEILQSLECIAEIAALSACLLIIPSVHLILSLVYSVYKRKQRARYAVLLVSGGSQTMVRRCAVTEQRILCAAGIPAGLAFGGMLLALLRIAANHLCIVWGGVSFPTASIGAKGILLCAVCAGAAVRGSVFVVGRKPLRGLKTSNAYRCMLSNAGGAEAISAMTEEPSAYCRFGIARYIAGRNLSESFNRNIIVILNVVLCILISTSSTALTAVILNGFPLQKISTTAVILYRAETYLCVVSGVIFLVGLVGTVCSVLSNADAGMGVYALMRSCGATPGCVRRTVRLESLFSVGVAILVGLIVMVWTVIFILWVTGVTENMSSVPILHDRAFLRVAVVDGLQLLLHACCTAAATVPAGRKVHRADLIRTLKNLSYSHSD